MSFNFMPKERELEINGHKFTITLGNIDAIERFDEMAAASNERLEAAVGGPRALCDRMRGQIEVILGPEGYEKVFAGRPVNILDHIELVRYLARQMTALGQDQERALLGPNKDPEVTAPAGAARGDDDTG